MQVAPPRVDTVAFPVCENREFIFHFVDFYVLSIGDKFLYKGKNWVKVSEDEAGRGAERKHFWPMFAAKLPKSLSEAEAIEKWPILAYSL